MNIIRQSLNFLGSTSLLFRNVNVSYFSQYFRQKDIHDLWEYNDRKIRNKKYRSLIALWKRPLQKKRLRQARIKQIKASLPQPQNQQQKLIVHNPAVGIRTHSQDNIFAVVKVDRRQYKVTNDCIILLDSKPEHQINKKINFQEVLLIGTETYTSLGRPVVKNATVQGIIESKSDTEKIIVFKKKRRKQYKKSFGSRSPVTSVRIVSIVHKLTEDVLSRAVPIQ